VFSSLRIILNTVTAIQLLAVTIAHKEYSLFHLCRKPGWIVALTEDIFFFVRLCSPSISFEVMLPSTGPGSIPGATTFLKK
jgi:hypothetical protein